MKYKIIILVVFFLSCSVSKDMNKENNNMNNNNPKFENSSGGSLQGSSVPHFIQADTGSQVALINDKLEFHDINVSDKLDRVIIYRSAQYDDADLSDYLIEHMYHPLFEEDVVKLALARRQVEPYHTEMINRFSYENWINNINKCDKWINKELNRPSDFARKEFLLVETALGYISSQKSYLELSNFLESDIQINWDSEDSNNYEYIGERVYQDIYFNLHNNELSPKRLVFYNEIKDCKRIKRSSPQECEKVRYADLRQWMIKNYGDYHFYVPDVGEKSIASIVKYTSNSSWVSGVYKSACNNNW